MDRLVDLLQTYGLASLQANGSWEAEIMETTAISLTLLDQEEVHCCCTPGLDHQPGLPLHVALDPVVGMAEALDVPHSIAPIPVLGDVAAVACGQPCIAQPPVLTALNVIGGHVCLSERPQAVECVAGAWQVMRFEVMPGLLQLTLGRRMLGTAEDSARAHACSGQSRSAARPDAGALAALGRGLRGGAAAASVGLAVASHSSRVSCIPHWLR